MNFMRRKAEGKKSSERCDFMEDSKNRDRIVNFANKIREADNNIVIKNFKNTNEQVHGTADRRP